MTVDLRPANRRFRADLGWLDSRSSFSFGSSYDPANISHGLLLVHNDDVVAPGSGFGEHPHRDMEIVTWVLEGSLVHADSLGSAGVIRPGLVQRLSAGRGIRHSERNDASPTGGGAAPPVHYLQMWVPPDEPGGDPGYAQREVGADLDAGGLLPIASGLPRHRTGAAIRLGNSSAALHAARLPAGESVALPDAPYLHLFVPRGSVRLEGTGAHADPGDAVRYTAESGQRVTATDDAEILVWEMHGRVG